MFIVVTYNECGHEMDRHEVSSVHQANVFVAQSRILDGPDGCASYEIIDENGADALQRLLRH